MTKRESRKQRSNLPAMQRSQIGLTIMPRGLAFRCEANPLGLV
ncbi:hypothetical protein [Porphyromonas pogonae]|nr:hypothetical protein [Porphyromonas pogonae]